MAHHPLIGYLVWALLFGALFAWEGLALSHLSNYVPTLSDTFRAIMRYRSAGGRCSRCGCGSAGIFSSAAGTSCSGPDMSSHLLRSDFDPMVGGYVIIMVALAVGLRLSRRPGAGTPGPARGPDLAPVTAAGWAGWPGTWPAPCWAATCC